MNANERKSCYLFVAGNIIGECMSTDFNNG
jgi:hypothetical protein